jgi:hypothetical protein
MQDVKQPRGESVFADPTELTIQLEASAIRMKWSPQERERRCAFSSGHRPLDADPVCVRTIFGEWRPK